MTSNNLFIAGSVTDFEGDSAVKQILIFSGHNAYTIFQEKYNEEKRSDVTRGVNAEYPSENNKGAIFKARAVKSGNGGWLSVVRCGISAICFHESSHQNGHPTWEAAMHESLEYIRRHINLPLMAYDPMNLCPMYYIPALSWAVGDSRHTVLEDSRRIQPFDSAPTLLESKVSHGRVVFLPPVIYDNYLCL